MAIKLGGPPKQQTRVFTTHGTVEKEKMTIDRGYMTSGMDAWTLNTAQQTTNEGKSIQWVMEGDCTPCILFPSRSNGNQNIDKNRVNKIAEETWDEELAFRDERKRKSRQTIYIGIVLVLLAITVLSIVATQVLSNSGGIKLPGM